MIPENEWSLRRKKKKKKLFLRRKYTGNTHVATWEKYLPNVPCQYFNKAMCFGPWSRQEKWGILITVSSKQITNGVLTLWKVPVAFYDDKYNSSSFSAWPLVSAASCNKNTFPGIRKRRGEYKRERFWKTCKMAPLLLLLFPSQPGLYLLWSGYKGSLLPVTFIGHVSLSNTLIKPFRIRDCPRSLVLTQLHICFWVCNKSAGAHGGWKEALDLLQPQWQAVSCQPPKVGTGTKLESSARTEPLNWWIISLAPPFYLGEIIRERWYH